MISLTAEIGSPSFSNTIIGNLVGRKCIWLCKLTVSYYKCCLTEFLWHGFKTSDKIIKQKIFALVLTEMIFIVLFQHILLNGNLYFNVPLKVHRSITSAIDRLDAQIFNKSIKILYMYMFRAISRSSSGGQIELIQHLVSSHSVSDCPVHRLRELSTCAPDGHLLTVTIPDAVLIWFDLLMMSEILLETCTCRGL
jgi:hypothetical protein